MTMMSSLGKFLLATSLLFISSFPCSSSQDSPPSRCSYRDNTMTCVRLPRGASFPPPEEVADRITTFIFTDCHFSTLPIVPYNNSAVRLIIRNSDVKSIPDRAFAGLSNLRFLEIGSNFVSDINKETFRGLSKLTFLVLTHNQLKVLPDDLFEYVPKLDQLDLTGNPHVSFGDELLTPAKELNTLILRYCGLGPEIPSVMLSKRPELTELDLDGNNFPKIEAKAFEELGKLRILSLDSCKISSIDDNAFFGLNRLKSLQLSNNNLKSISSEVTGNVKDTLTRVWMNGNQLQALDHDLLNWEETEVHFMNNNWKCDCGVYWMQQLPLAENTTCASPAVARGYPVHNITAHMDCDCDEMGHCQNHGSKSVVALAVSIPIVIICALLIGYYVYRIIQSRREREQHKSVRYSSIYKDTVETSHPKPVSNI